MRASILPVAAAFAFLTTASFAQTETPKGYTGAYAPPGTPPAPYSTGPLPTVDNVPA
jgi:hypothetical protein